MSNEENIVQEKYCSKKKKNNVNVQYAMKYK